MIGSNVRLGGVITGLSLRTALVVGAVLGLWLLSGIPGRDAAPTQAAFPGANGKIAFHVWEANEFDNPDIHVTNADGTDEKLLIADAALPAWSADGRKIAFVRHMPGGDRAVWTADADGSGQTLVAENALSGGLTWSPDGSEIAFTSAMGTSVTDTSLSAVNVNSGVVRQIVASVAIHPGTYAINPAWSPDGTKIAFNHGSGIFLINPDGSGLQALHSGYHPAWSPDGSEIAYWSLSSSVCGPGICAVSVTGGGTRTIVNSPDFFLAAGVAWSPDGEFLVGAGTGGPVVGEAIFVVGESGGAPQQLTFFGDTVRAHFPDWQPLPRTPIVFLHGFLGSTINCESNQLWPDVPPDFKEMGLAADGVSPAADACAATVGGIVDSFLGSSVYDTAINYLNGTHAGNAHFFAWDWRKSPEPSLPLLDSFIDDILADTGAEQVVLVGHSYGGLLARWYIDDPGRAEKVARVLTIGTPAWGAPKALFPLFAGIETPGSSELDSLIILNNAALKEFSKNLFGNYFLFPSANYGPWLTLLPNNTPQGQQGVADYVAALGGNPGLLSQALDRHATTLDSISNTNGVPFEVVAGAGLLTISSVRINSGNGSVILEYGNGDGTVPVRSAARGAPAAGNPNSAHTHYSCGVGHVPLPGHQQVTDAITAFLRDGDPIEGLSNTACPASGNQFRIFNLSALPAGVVQSEGEGPITAKEADALGLVDYLDFPNEKFIVTGAEFPEMVLPAAESLEITPVDEDGTKGPPLLYGPLTGEITVAMSDSGPVVMDDGEPVEGVEVTGTDRTWGDLNCSGSSDPVDALLVLRSDAGQSANTGECPAIGATVTADAHQLTWGDVDCSSNVDPVDSLKLLRFDAGLGVAKQENCPELGTSVTIVGG